MSIELLEYQQARLEHTLEFLGDIFVCSRRLRRIITRKRICEETDELGGILDPNEPEVEEEVESEEEDLYENEAYWLGDVGDGDDEDNGEEEERERELAAIRAKEHEERSTIDGYVSVSVVPQLMMNLFRVYGLAKEQIDSFNDVCTYIDSWKTIWT